LLRFIKAEVSSLRVASSSPLASAEMPWGTSALAENMPFIADSTSARTSGEGSGHALPALPPAKVNSARRSACISIIWLSPVLSDQGEFGSLNMLQPLVSKSAESKVQRTTFLVIIYLLSLGIDDKNLIQQVLTVTVAP
jgi:hypothetical protein